MNFRVILFAIVAAASASNANAQPGKEQQRAKSPEPIAPPPVVLASASDVRKPTNPSQSTPVRRPAPRVTTCRCGDLKANQDQSVEQQPDE